MEPTFDRNGDPTDATLEVIQYWNMHDFEGLAKYVCAAWSCDYGLFALTHDEAGRFVLKLVTGGWSSNESIIVAMRLNVAWWMINWEMSKRGGAHRFEQPDWIGI